MSSRKILVTSALPYANAPLHLGHMLEQVQTDIWVRFQRSRGNHCQYVCADDAHGTAIMLSAEKQGVTPQAHIGNIKALHEADSAGFHISFDNYHSTHSPENKAWSETIFQRLEANDHIAVRSVVQAYDEVKGLFLADRFIKGTCPKCKTPDQYGDNCEACGATYSPTEVIDPISALSGSTPVEKASDHLFFKLSAFQELLADWVSGEQLQTPIANKLREWIDAGLQDWDISRDAPYFGFEIPGYPEKYFYVWLDAPIGYIASHQNLCARTGDDFESFWQPGNDTELYHFIGKDIINFHGLFWPAMLASAGLRQPTAIFAHGFLTVDGTKMSKSRGTFIMASTYLDHLDAEYLRYYFAAKLSPNVDDMDLNLEDFIQRVNSDLVGKVVNIASRCSGFLRKRFDNEISTTCSEPAFINELISAGDSIAALYETRDFQRAMREIIALADRANQYIDEKKPWVLAKEEGRDQDVQDACSVGINCFRVLMTYLKPVLPVMGQKSEEFLGLTLNWTDLQGPLEGHKINKFSPLIQRIDPEAVTAMVEASKH
ncbi:methionine--tRNA ligase [Candidatus Paraluminiphilus aquimaris]|uniref:Methionine--tRNA ligase n=1 Tax=Candidatus Paraluminiphilus aquimaris TaxID=2518994 RepID=A0ABY6Q8Y5_9GAMM|nr:methionine--tRNA ligase [Candidatus Paraluminiphilus aquimaris]UZP75385.1 methionine--tRNA ligase [Candidatus Paraluminiphilus aquimaris]